MAGSKEIRTKIKSVENTRKITKAMEMVAASKMRKAQDRMRAARPYAEKIRNVAAHMSHAEPEYKHAFLVKRDNVKNVGVIVVTSDKGLCGGLNTNVLRVAVNQMQAWEAENLSVKVCAIGNKGLGFMSRINANVQSQLTGLGDAPQMEKLIGPIKVMLDAYVAGEIDQLYVVYNKFINAMKQETKVDQLLPLSGENLGAPQGHWDYIYEPEAPELLNGLLVRYIESVVYQGVVENIASEQAARMVAMKAATDNAGSLIKSLQLVYNKLRQAAITREISEIVGGAAAV